MKRWVIDTNVVVSALLSADGPCARVLDGIIEGRAEMVYDSRVLAEYRDVLCRPRLRLKPRDGMRFLESLRGQVLVTADRIAEGGPDPDGRKFVEVALMVPERTIVTGYLADYPEDLLHGVRLLTPVQALAEMAAKG
jgi:predicted nucleic acid-binding protein